MGRSRDDGWVLRVAMAILLRLCIYGRLENTEFIVYSGISGLVMDSLSLRFDVSSPRYTAAVRCLEIVYYIERVSLVKTLIRYRSSFIKPTDVKQMERLIVAYLSSIRQSEVSISDIFTLFIASPLSLPR